MRKTTREMPPAADHVAHLLAQRAKESPDLDLSGMAILARARRITLMSRKPIEAVFARHGIDTGEFDVLGTLQRSGPPYALRPTELFRTLMISSGGMTDRLRRLEEAGLIRRRAAKDDGRSLLVELTAKGLAKIDAAYREDMAVENKIVAALTAAEQSTLAALLAKLAQAMEQTIDDDQV